MMSRHNIVKICKHKSIIRLYLNNKIHKLGISTIELNKKVQLIFIFFKFYKNTFNNFELLLYTQNN
jgi:hypothetical protein